MPARKARGAIVEKGEDACKVIGDYLNNLPNTTKQLWEGACPRLLYVSHCIGGLIHRHREQAPSHIWNCAESYFFLALAFAPR